MSGGSSDSLAVEKPEDRKGSGKRAFGTNPTGQRGSEDFPEAEKIHHFHTDWQVGDKCNCCSRGRLKEFRRNKKLPSKALILAGSLFRSEVHIFHDLRCNSCDEVFRVPPSEKARAEGLDRGASGLSYGYSAIALIAIQTYFYGMPWYRSSKMAGAFSLPVSRSTMQDQVEKLSGVIRPMIREQFSEAANCWLQMGDDTSRKVLELSECLEPVSGRNTKGRCSLIVGFREKDSFPVAIVKIGQQHTGDMFDDLLKERDPDLKPPLLMSDGAVCNQTSSGLAIHLSCLQHARDKFIKCKNNWPEKDLIPLKLINRVFKNDRATTKMNNDDRLSYHQKHSSDLINQLLDECDRILKEVAPPASALGESAQYILNRREELAGFLKYPGAPLSNNLIESIFGSVIAITRKNSGPHKKILGATWAADILSIGITALLCGLDLQQYFVLLLQNAGEIKKSPSEYTPWNFQMDSSGTITRRKIDRNQIRPLSQAPPPPFRAPFPKPTLTRPEKYLKKLLAG